MWIVYFLIGLQLGNLAFMLRNQAVYRFRRQLLEEVKDIVRPEVALPLLDEMARVSYNEMVYKFWRPLPSFYSERVLKLLE